MKHLILLHDQHWKPTFCMYKLSLGCQIKSNTCMVPVQVPMLELVYLPGMITIGLGALENHSFFSIYETRKTSFICPVKCLPLFSSQSNNFQIGCFWRKGKTWLFFISYSGDKETPTCRNDHKAACRSGLKFYTLTLSRYLDHEVPKIFGWVYISILISNPLNIQLQFFLFARPHSWKILCAFWYTCKKYFQNVNIFSG